MYADDRKDKLKAIEQRAKEELGMADTKSAAEGRIRGSFLNATKYARRRKERMQSGGIFLSTGVIILLLILLLVVWRLLFLF